MPSMSSVALAIAVAGATFAIALSCAALLLVRNRPSTTGLRAALRDANAPLEQAVGELSRALASAQLGLPGEATAAAVGLDEVLRRTLSAVRQAGADAAAIVVDDREGGSPRVATSGLPATAVFDPSTLRPNGVGGRTTVARYGYLTEPELDEPPLGAGIGVPLRGRDGEPRGTLAAFWRYGGLDPDEEEITRLEQLAAAAGPALERASSLGSTS